MSNFEMSFMNHDELASKGIEGDKSNRPEFLQGHPAFMTDEELQSDEHNT